MVCELRWALFLCLFQLVASLLPGQPCLIRSAPGATRFLRSRLPRLVLEEQAATRGEELERVQIGESMARASIGGYSTATTAGKAKPLSLRVKKAMIKRVNDASDGLWRAVFDECDLDKDGQLTTRELLVLIKRLGLDIPSVDELNELLRELDEDENGLIDFDELNQIAFSLGVDRAANSAVGFRTLLSAHLKERRSIVLWRTIFDGIDRFPSDGRIDAEELKIAFGQSGVGLDGVGLSSEKVSRLMAKYDTDSNGSIDFGEFCAMATDLISSTVQYERAQRNRCAQSTLFSLAECGRRAEVANSHRALSMIASNATELTSEEQTALGEIEARLEGTFSQSNTLADPTSVLGVQDDLYLKYRIKYAPNIDDTLSAERVQLLDAIKGGDLDTVRSLMSIDWNFVYPPAYVDAEGTRHLEAWCRTPLTLIVRPNEGDLANQMRDVTSEDRISLLLDVLASGCADPNFPPLYWSRPALHACLEGDLEVLELLRLSGCDLQQACEWATQHEPKFDLVHAAAFSGQQKVLGYLREHFPPSFFQRVDAQGNNALHTLLASSRDVGTARFLIEQEVDGFAFNLERRSPLSMSIERLPELAQVLLETKSRFEYSWWGMNVYYFSFDGVVLPLEPRTDADECAFPGGSCGPLRARNHEGELKTIEQLIIDNECKALLETPIMLDLVDCKWRYFGSEVYRTRVAKFSALLAAVFVASVLEPGSPGSSVASVVTLTAWALNLQVSVEASRSSDGLSLAKKLQRSTALEALDTFHLVVVPILVTALLTEAAGISVQLPGRALGTGLLQVTLSVRLLSYISFSRALGPLIVTARSMVNDALRFSGLLGVIGLGYVNGVYTLIHYGMSEADLAALEFDFSYIGILTETGNWLTGSGDLNDLEGLSAETEFGVACFYWTFVAAAQIGLLNLLIAIFSSTYERIISNSIAEWLFLKLSTLLEFESDYQREGVQRYYNELAGRNAKRNVMQDAPKA